MTFWDFADQHTIALVIMVLGVAFFLGVTVTSIAEAWEKKK